MIRLLKLLKWLFLPEIEIIKKIKIKKIETHLNLKPKNFIGYKNDDFMNDNVSSFTKYKL
jgi:hypothetical protein